jgi:hypothetical protein
MRSTCASAAMRAFAIFFFIPSASWPAITALMAAAVTSSRMPFSSRQLSNVEPICRFFLPYENVSRSSSAFDAIKVKSVPFAAITRLRPEG